MKFLTILVMLVTSAMCAYADLAVRSLPVCKKDTVIIANHYMYAVGFSMRYGVALWSQYILSSSNFRKKDVDRLDGFVSDVMVPNSPTPKVYDKSGYDRGHLAPADDFDWSELAMSESFLMTNIAPQLAGFNRGIWKKLEN